MSPEVSGFQPLGILPHHPLRYFWKCLETFLVIMTGWCWYYWHGVGRGQGCWETPYSAQGSSNTKKYLAPNVHSA